MLSGEQKAIETFTLTIVFAIFLCEYETWFPTLKGEYEVYVSENKVLRKIFELKKD
jgi:hypothetical protein